MSELLLLLSSHAEHAEGKMLLIAEALVQLGTEVGLLRKRRLLTLVPVCGMEPPLCGFHLLPFIES